MTTQAAVSSTPSIALVQQIFEAFSKGEIPYILSQLTPDCHWEQAGNPNEIPTSGLRIGSDAIQDFFKTLSETERITRFEPREFFTNGDDVVVLGYEEMEAPSTGKTARTQWAMVFRFRQGKVSRWDMHLDTAAMANAYKP